VSSPSVNPPFQSLSTRLLFFGGFLLSTLVFARLATTARPRDQWIGWSICWTILLAFLTVLLRDLSPAG